MLVPERTVDSLLAHELLRAFPTAVLWSPTNTRNSLDHELKVGGSRAILFECKGLREGWRIPIRIPQLDEYVSRGLGRLLYLLPSQPANLGPPWQTLCAIDPDGNGMCKACGPQGPGGQRRLAQSDPHVRASAPERRLQPWFGHWAWCIPASLLQVHLNSTRGEERIAGDDAVLASIPGAQRLCHVLPDPFAVSVASQPAGNGSGSRGPSSGDGRGSGFGGSADGTDGPRWPLGDSFPPIDKFQHELEEVKAFWTNFDPQHPNRMRPGSVGILL